MFHFVEMPELISYCLLEKVKDGEVFETEGAKP
jgi:hypothetical protein